MLLVLRPFRIGEDVEVGAVAGKIEEIGLFATRLRTVDGIYVLAPNAKLWNEPVRNFSRNGVRRNDITITLGPEDDVELARATLADLAASDERVKQQPAPTAFVSEIAADGKVGVTLRYWTPVADFSAAKFDLTRQVKLTLDRKPFAKVRGGLIGRTVQTLPPLVLSRKCEIHRQRRLRGHRRETAGLVGRHGARLRHAPDHEQAE